MDVVWLFPLVVLLQAPSATRSCNCESFAGKVLNVQAQLEQLKKLVDVLNMKMAERVKKEHEDNMAALTSNVIPVMVDDVKKCLREFDARLSKGEAKLEWLSEEVETLRREKAVLESDLKRSVSVSLKRTVREVDEKMDRMSTSFKSRLKSVQQLSEHRLEAMERQMKVDNSVVELLEEARPSSNPAEDVLEIVFVDGADAKGDNFSINVTKEGYIFCPRNSTCNGTENGTQSDAASPADFDRKASVGETSRWSVGQVVSALTKKLAAVQKNISVLNSLEQKVSDVQRNISSLNLQDRLGQLEHEASASISDVREVIADVELKVWNLTDRVQLASELQQNERSTLKRLQNESDRAKDMLVETVSEVRAMESAVLDLEDFKNSTSVLVQNLTVVSKYLLNDVKMLNETVESTHGDAIAAVQQLNSSVAEDVSSLNSSMMDSVQTLNKSFEERVEVLNNTLSKRVEVIQETLNESLAVGMQQLKTTVLNMTNPQELRGWHPNDSLPCPGLLFLSQSANLVLTTDNGTFKSPHLSEEPLPAGSRVHFRCEHQGLFRLEGEQVIRCASGRWSARPPTCVPLPTLEDLKSNRMTDDIPSVLYGTSQSTGPVTDKRGVLTVYTGLYFELTCLYPKERGSVSWLHNGTVVPYPSAAWSSGADAGYAYVLRINKTDHADSGTYTCVGPAGRNHTIRLRVEGVECGPLDAPVNGSIATGDGSTAMGSRVKFSCLLGYRLEGNHELTCLASGQWSSAKPVCVEIEDYVPPRTACTQPRVSGGLDVVPVQRYYADNSRVAFVCQNGRRVIGKATSMCRRGRWTDGVPICD